jgi:hypothetical protein
MYRGDGVIDFILRYWLEALFGCLLTGLSLWVRSLYRQITRNKRETFKVQEGIKCMLRDRIVQNHERYTRLGYCPLFIRQNLEDMHMAYKALGGNGAIDHIVSELDQLPTITKEKCE